MRVLGNIRNYIHYACSNSFIVLAVCLIAAVGAAALGVHAHNSASTASAFSRDCDDNAIVRCGIANYADLTRAYDQNQDGDVQAIYDHYWIQRTPSEGDQILNGWARPDGTVTAAGRVVAKNATSIGRKPIMHSHPISIAGRTYYETPHSGGQAFKDPNSALETLVVLDSKGNFKYAVIKACGNPIYATPVPPPAPKPKYIKVCDLETKKVVSINENDYNSQRYSKNLDDCKTKYLKVCDLETKKVVNIPEDKFDSERYSKNLDDCKHEPITYIKVCDTETNSIVSVTEKTAESSRYTKDYDACKTKCTFPGKENVNQDSDECKPCKYDSRIAYDSDKCQKPEQPAPKPTPKPTPQELPETGIENGLSVLLGLMSMSLAAYYYALSRR